MIKKLTHVLLTGTILIGLGYVLWLGVRKQKEKTEDASSEAAAPAEESAAEEFVVTIEKKQAGALALEKEQPEKTAQQARRVAFGTVLDPLPLVTLDGEWASAEAALLASKAERERTQLLASTNDAPKKAVEAAEALFNADRIKLETLVRRAQVEWGALLTNDAALRRKFVDELVSGRIALIRVDLMPGSALAELPKSASVVVLGREDQPFLTTEILPATATDAKTQAQGFILRTTPPFTLRPGMALTAWLELPTPPRPGYMIPRSAVLRHDGRTWVYVQEEEEKYVRKAIKLDSPLEGEEGWFIQEDGGLTADDVIVVVGAASLLSEELKAKSGGGAD